MRLTSILTLVAALPSSTSAFVARPTSWVSQHHGLAAATTSAMDTAEVLPDFSNKDEYLAYMETVSGLPKGFATGTANGKFVSAEAPAMGPLPIRATVIYLTEGHTDNWAAVFTKNKVRDHLF